ncbi:hypothetical protein [Paracoccus alcaliphilus]|uniref:hypothetical protein n=1 Tax=Paracoccus alcaliphilus TaxID=34002 RepID=UPI00147A5804|nr:hypothetical protein [Paracoccus alcaliphilus]
MAGGTRLVFRIHSSVTDMKGMNIAPNTSFAFFRASSGALAAIDDRYLYPQ